MELSVLSEGKEVSKVTLSDQFDCPFNEGLVHQVVTSYLATKRAGTKAQKNRARASGGGVKPWRQKGTGRARAGSIRSPIWRGGGVTFAAQPRDHSQKINRKMYRRAMLVILSELARQERLIVVKDFTVSKPKTRELLDKLKTFELDNVLCVVENEDRNLMLAARNLSNVEVVEAAEINPVDLIAYDKLVVTVDALKKIEERLS